MKQNYITGLALAVGLLAVAGGCHKIESDGVSAVTNYVTFDLKGDNPVVVPVGTAYTDAGVVAMEGDKDVSAAVVVNNQVDATKLGVYEVIYSAINADGFPASASRTVAVCNTNVTTDISGTYKVNVPDSYRKTISTGAVIKYDAVPGDVAGYTVTITKLAPGIFYVSDFFAGFYHVRAGYGAVTDMTGNLSIDESDQATVLSSYVAGWEDGLEGIEDFQFDGTNLSYATQYTANMIFYVSLIKQ